MKEQIKELSETERLERQIGKLIRSQSYTRTFVKGILSGLGNAIGATLVVAVVFWFLNQLPLVPLIGAWFADIVKSAQQNLVR